MLVAALFPPQESREPPEELAIVNGTAQSSARVAWITPMVFRADFEAPILGTLSRPRGGEPPPSFSEGSGSSTINKKNFG